MSEDARCTAVGANPNISRWFHQVCSVEHICGCPSNQEHDRNVIRTYNSGWWSDVKGGQIKGLTCVPCQQIYVYISTTNDTHMYMPHALRGKIIFLHDEVAEVFTLVIHDSPHSPSQVVMTCYLHTALHCYKHDLWVTINKIQQGLISAFTGRPLHNSYNYAQCRGLQPRTARKYSARQWLFHDDKTNT